MSFQAKCHLSPRLLAAVLQAPVVEQELLLVVEEQPEVVVLPLALEALLLVVEEQPEVVVLPLALEALLLVVVVEQELLLVVASVALQFQQAAYTV